MQTPKKNSGAALMKILGSLKNNIGMKLLSVVLAIILWTIVVYNDDSITRSRTVSGLGATLSGQSSLSDNYLALAYNPVESMDDISVELEVPQSQYSRVTENNVRVRLDLSNVRSAGTQLVPLSVSTTYGTVKSVYPPAIEVEIEALDSRIVPLNASITGKGSGNYWYNVRSLNPSTITVSGASSIVQNVAEGRVTVNVEDMEESGIRAYTFHLYDYAGNEVSQELLTKTSSSVSANIEVYPTKELSIYSDIDDVLDGTIAEGFEVESVIVTPSVITVAADQELLDSLTTLALERIVANDVNQSFTVRSSIAKLNGIRSYSAEQVYVTVNVKAIEDTVVFTDVPVSLLNLPSHLRPGASLDTLSVQVTGPFNEIDDLTIDMLQVTVDLTDSKAGTAEYPVQISVPGRPQLTFKISLPELSITLAERDAGEANQ